VITILPPAKVRKRIREFWTSGQRQAASIHEISYRACFKPQLPRYFIEKFTSRGDVVYDPFSGRGTTAIESGLLGRRVVANDLNPLSVILTRPRFFIPDPSDVEARLSRLKFSKRHRRDIDLSMFYHNDTQNEILSLRQYLRDRRDRGEEDDIDRWIRMVATNRLTGHSSGFFSVYTLPPNQAATPERQKLINKKLGQRPPYRDTRAIILKKTRSLLRNLSPDDRTALLSAGQRAVFHTGAASHTPGIPARSVSLTVTSPHFLDVVRYDDDNWLRCWFNDIPTEPVQQSIDASRTLEGWTDMMHDVLRELYRITRKGGIVAMEVGEVRRQQIKLDEILLPLGASAGFEPFEVMINSQRFTKTSNIWGVHNNNMGTNTNRIVLFRK
jgi:hypothetical protein